MSDKIYDVAIIGAGASGITAAIYCARAGLSVALIEKGLYGGQINDTTEVENYTAFESISGLELAENMEKHVKSLDGIDHIYGDAKNISRVVYHGIAEFNIELQKDTIKSKTAVIASGVKHKKLDITGEDILSGSGVSYCATCDGSFFKGQHVAVVGGGDSAVESALYLSNIVERVTVIHRRDELRAEQILQDRLFDKNNVEVIWNAEVEEIKGDKTMDGLIFKDKNTGDRVFLDAAGAFINIGVEPNTELLKTNYLTDSEGFIYTNPMMQTKMAGLYAVGDVRWGSIRQIASSVGDGAVCVESIIKYLNQQ